MYVFFEHHKDATGKVLATDLIWSSYKTGTGIFWNKDRALHDFILQVAKTPRLSERSFNTTTKVWSYFGTAGPLIVAQIKALMTTAGLISKFEFIEIQNLSEQLENGGIREKTEKYDPENFYYNKNAPATKSLSTGQIKQKLAAMFNITVEEFDKIEKEQNDTIKKWYRKAALNYHPDRNGGDGSKMSELNMYWRMYNG